MKAAVFITEIIVYEIVVDCIDKEDAEKQARRLFDRSKEGFKIIEHDYKIDDAVQAD